MPMKFEYDHLIHPATLDAMFQTVFTLGDRRMLPVAVDSVQLSADISHTPGTEFYGLSAAEVHFPAHGQGFHRYGRCCR